MELFSIVFFLASLYGFGSSISFIAKESEDFLERHLMRLGIGLGIMIFFGFLLNLARIPLDWKVFLATAILIVIARIYIDHRKKELLDVKFNLNLYSILVLAMFAVTFYMYSTGAFAYPYLEDDDSWSHAMGVKYVALEKTVFTGNPSPFHYISPYPPAYDMILGIIHQTNNSVYWTLKFFNALIISLGIVFFYYFVKSFTGSSRKALFSAFALFAVPAYLSHFIWALALTMTLFFVSFYCTERIKSDRRWWIVAAMVIMPTVTSSPTHSMYFGLFFILYLVGKLISNRKLPIYESISGIAGVAAAFVLWWLPEIITFTFKGVLKTINPRIGAGGAFSVIGTGDKVYTLSDFLCQPGTPCYSGQNMINNPIGIGWVLSILAVIGLIILISRYKSMFKENNSYILVLLLWFLLAFYAVNAAKMPVKLSPFRAWMVLAIPVAILAGESISFIAEIAKSTSKQIKIGGGAAALLVLATIGMIFFGIFMTSFLPKYKVNTANWGPGAFWTSVEEMQGYIWLKDNIPANSKVFTFSNNGVIIGLDKFICHWCPEVRELQKTGINMTAAEIHSRLRSDGYQYIVIDGQAVKKFGQNETNVLLKGFGNLGLRPIVQNSGIVVFKI